MEPGLELSSPASRLASPPAVPRSPERLTSGGPDGGKANRQVEAGLHLEHEWGEAATTGQLTQKTQSPSSMVRLQELEGGVTELETTKAFPPQQGNCNLAPWIPGALQRDLCSWEIFRAEAEDYRPVLHSLFCSFSLPGPGGAGAVPASVTKRTQALPSSSCHSPGADRPYAGTKETNNVISDRDH